MIYENKLNDELKSYIKENHGWSKEELEKTELYQRYLKEIELIKENFENKKVKLFYKKDYGYFENEGEKIGKIKAEKFGNRIILKFYENQYRTKFLYIDLGLYEMFSSTLIIKKIIPITNKGFRK